ncbi:MAG: PTS lactose/cellobiose transporter subunit IIA [Clostridium sp.]|uniref:PTS lactose/cellobiose transporter subunit IIA n=1 Tax=Clostridium sp. TaxID=1506 RepID=UPI003F2A5D09
MKENEKRALEIIGVAGEGRREIFKALQMAKKGEKDKSKAIMEEARIILNGYKKVKETEGQGLLMIHAEDHLMNTLIIFDVISELIDIYSEGRIRDEV